MKVDEHLTRILMRAKNYFGTRADGPIVVGFGVAATDGDERPDYAVRCWVGVKTKAGIREIASGRTWEEVMR